MKVLVAGGPKTGKTTLASNLLAGTLEQRELELMGARGVMSTDDLIDTHDWSAASAEVARWMEQPGPWVIEGVAVPRALRKWLLAHPDEKPCDVVYWSDRPKAELNPRQLGMARGCATVWDQVRDELVLRGVEIRFF